MKLILGLAIIFIAFANSVADEAPDLLWGGGINTLLTSQDSFGIIVSDEVSGGCLPQPSILKDRMEISLRKYGFGIEKEPSTFTNNIHIVALGFKTDEALCVVHLSSKLVFLALVKVPFSKDVINGNETFVPYVYVIGNVLLSGPSGSMQGRLEKKVEEYADKLYLDLARAKDDIFSKFPVIHNNIKKHKEGK